MGSFCPLCLPVPWVRVAVYLRPSRHPASASAVWRASLVRSLPAPTDRQQSDPPDRLQPDPPGLAPRFFSPSGSPKPSLRQDCAARITMTIYGIFMGLAHFPNRFHCFGFCRRIFVNRRINPFFAESSAHSESYWRRSVFFGPRKKKSQRSANPENQTPISTSNAMEQYAYIGSNPRISAVFGSASA